MARTSLRSRCLPGEIELRRRFPGVGDPSQHREQGVRQLRYELLYRASFTLGRRRTQNRGQRRVHALDTQVGIKKRDPERRAGEKGLEFPEGLHLRARHVVLGLMLHWWVHWLMRRGLVGGRGYL